MIRIVILLGIMVGSCAAQQLEKDFFFKQPPENRLERIRHYSLPDQYKIFRYGNDKIEPPVMELAGPIAEKGAAAVPFLMDQLKSSTDLLTVRDILLILKTMSRSKTYDVKGDTALMALLEAKISKIKDKEWQAFCHEGLQQIKDSK